ncbi:DMT family transporter [Oligoflexia bacterium]|nr:DMT family transporter [Oligoflexia bacterium]
MSWHALTLMALLAYGFQSFLNKVSAKSGCNTVQTTLAFMGTATIISWSVVLYQGFILESFALLLVLAVANSFTYSASTIARIEAHKFAPAGVVFPIVRMSTVLVVLFSLLWFHEHLSIYQAVGILLAIFAVLILSRYSNNDKGVKTDFSKGIALALLALVSGAAATIVSKFAAIYFPNPCAFMAISYALNVLIAFSLRNKFQDDTGANRRGHALVIGALMGVANFIGFYLLLAALAVGPLSVIAPINSLSTVLAIGLAILIYKEALTWQRGVGIVGALVAVSLLST